MRPGVSTHTTRYLKPVFWLTLAVWSWLLVKPNPFPEVARRLASWYDFLPYLAAKTLHLSGYAFLTVVGMAGVTPPWRRWVLLLVILHGPLSELGQHLGNIWFDTKRSGMVKDVVVDWIGVAAGCGAWAAARRMSRR